MSNGVAVTTWRDLSANHNDAVPGAGLDGDAGNPPATPPARMAKGLAGFDVVAFDGVSSGMQIAPSATLEWGADDYLVEVVVSYTNAPGSNDVNALGMLWGHQSTTFPYPGAVLFANVTNFYVDDGGPHQPDSVFYAQVRTPGAGPGGGVASAKHGYDDGKWHLAGMLRRGRSTLEVRVDGASAGRATIAQLDVSAYGRPATFGRNGDGQLLAGSIAEIVAVHVPQGGVICDSDVAALEAYAKARYGL